MPRNPNQRRRREEVARRRRIKQNLKPSDVELPTIPPSALAADYIIRAVMEGKTIQQTIREVRETIPKIQGRVQHWKKSGDENLVRTNQADLAAWQQTLDYLLRTGPSLSTPDGLSYFIHQNFPRLIEHERKSDEVHERVLGISGQDAKLRAGSIFRELGLNASKEDWESQLRFAMTQAGHSAVLKATAEQFNVKLPQKDRQWLDRTISHFLHT
ncbi:MAG: hypothetical protein Q7R47_00385, partial [Candidatus Diapherotrites archaeon]|nr:hypothetical protein [Candidatus Diapherotrites archaeon]